MLPQHLCSSHSLEDPLPYLLYTPEASTDEKRKQLPLILFLHGSGERGSDLERVKAHGLPRELERGSPLPDSAFVLAPQCPAASWWTLELGALEGLLEDALERLPVDPARVYLTGLSMGGYGAWHLALKMARKPPVPFAALAPVCGGGIPALAHTLKNLPTWAFHGADDTVVPLSESEKMVQALRDAGGEVRFTIYPDTGHNSWVATYQNLELYAWLFAQRLTHEE